ncbi:MAG: hypothetical protein ACE5EE_01095 [Fidelibacterota bacterium]
MKSILTIIIQVLIGLEISFLVSCQQTTESSDGDFQLQINLEIVSYTDIPSSWDSTFYQHNLNWIGFFDTTAADSLADVLKDSNLPIVDMWFPQEESICSIPLRVGSEVILKLNSVDSSIVLFGFQSPDGFPLSCVRKWRHYIFSEVSQSDSYPR